MEVRVSAALAGDIARRFGPERSASGAPSELDFWSGPLQAALLGFRDFGSLPFDVVPQIRHLTVIDPLLGPVTFAAVLLPDDVVEIVMYSDDPDYWRLIEDEPDEWHAVAGSVAIRARGRSHTWMPFELGLPGRFL